MADFCKLIYPNAGVSVSMATPFYPILVEEVGAVKKYSFNQGYVFDHRDDGEAVMIAIEGMDQSWEVSAASGKTFYVKMSDIDDPEASITAVFTNSDAISESETGYTLTKVCKFDNNLVLESFWVRENIHIFGGSASVPPHSWQVTEYMDGATPKWYVLGGFVYSHGVTIEVPAMSLPVAGSRTSGFIVLKITRNSDSRVMESAELKLETTVSGDNYNEQYRPIAIVDATDNSVLPILQLQFEEIRIQELMIVANGEFKLGSFELSSRDIYELPS